MKDTPLFLESRSKHVLDKESFSLQSWKEYQMVIDEGPIE